MKGVWASPDCFRSPIGDLSATDAPEVSRHSVTKNPYAFEPHPSVAENPRADAESWEC